MVQAFAQLDSRIQLEEYKDKFDLQIPHGLMY